MPLAYAINLWLMQHYELARLPGYCLPVGVLALCLLGQLAVYGPARRAAAVPPAVATRSVSPVGRGYAPDARRQAPIRRMQYARRPKQVPSGAAAPPTASAAHPPRHSHPPPGTLPPTPFFFLPNPHKP